MKNVVVSDASIVKVLRMVGRIRKGSADNITLYIKKFDAQQISNIIYHLKEQQDAYHKYDTMIDDVKYHDKDFFNEILKSNPNSENMKKHWFGLDNYSQTPYAEDFYYNKIARSMTDKLIKKYEYILNEMLNEKDEGQGYLKYMLSFFENEYNEENDMTIVGIEQAENELIKFFESYYNKGGLIHEDEQMDFRERFTELYDAAFGRADKNKERIYRDKIFNIHEKYDLGYQVVRVEKSKNWKIIKLESPNIETEE